MVGGAKPTERRSASGGGAYRAVVAVRAAEHSLPVISRPICRQRRQRQLDVVMVPAIRRRAGRTEVQCAAAKPAQKRDTESFR